LHDSARYRFWGHHFLARGLRPESIPDIGIGCAGEQRDDADAFGAEFFAEGVGEAEGSVLGGVVGCVSGEDAGGRDGEIVHDGAAALHHCQCRLGHEEHSGQIGFENIFPGGKRKLFDGQIGMGNAGVVDEDVEAAELLPRGAEKIVDGVRVAEIAGVREDSDFRGR